MFTGISLLGFMLFYFYPIVRTLILSFTDTEGIGIGGEQFVGFDNYIYALKYDDLFLLSIKQSLIYAFVSGVFVMITSPGSTWTSFAAVTGATNDRVSLAQVP
jgi:ABC-type sugar transport system permease subunit